ncbi:MAG: DUF4062 domain-containing protein [Clostridiales bacterium]|nr:DUF4062 domain-containing protein [Clostridiales bacterium]
MNSTLIKRHQVFLGSTYEDLRDERKAVLDTLLRADYIPVGMEMFGAAPATSWDVIEKTIDISDFYVLLIGFRYGSELNGKSFTELEYDYAVSKGIPVLTFIQDRKKAEVTEEKRETAQAQKKKLDEFIERIDKQCDYWININDLPAKVTIALTKAAKNAPDGWYRLPTTHLPTCTKESHYVFISALEKSSADDMRKTAHNQKDLPFYADLSRNEVVHLWDVAGDFGNDGSRLGNITEQHIPAIMKYLQGKMKEVVGVQDIKLFYAGPTGLAFHIGCLLANGPTPQIYQSTGNIYRPLGTVSKA